MTKCFLHYQLLQRAYLADIRKETAEAERLRNEITAHVGKCAVCRGLAEVSQLADQLFGSHVVIRREQDRE